MRSYIATWDWKEKPDLNELAGFLKTLGVYLYEVNTESDFYAVVVTDQQISAVKADNLFWDDWDKRGKDDEEEQW